MKISAIRRALLLANIFNLLVSLYFIIIAIIALVQLRWYHQLTVTVKVRYLLTSVTSYFAFFILILAGLLLLAIFVTGVLGLSPRATYSTQVDHDDHDDDGQRRQSSSKQHQRHQRVRHHDQTATTNSHRQQERRRRIVLRDSHAAKSSSHSPDEPGTTNTSVCCSILVHLLAATCLVIILIIWLFNTGELVRDSISSQLDAAFAKYQFTNRTNHYTVAIDGMQDINNCCGSLDYADFPRQRSGLPPGHYPGSCCAKNIWGVNARPLCVPEEIWRAKQTTGCTTVLANYYDLISLLVVPVALVSLFVNIIIIASITILKGSNHLAPGGHELDGILPSSSGGGGGSNNNVTIADSTPNPRHTAKQQEDQHRAVGSAGDKLVNATQEL